MLGEKKTLKTSLTASIDRKVIKLSFDLTSNCLVQSGCNENIIINRRAQRLAVIRVNKNALMASFCFFSIFFLLSLQYELIYKIKLIFGSLKYRRIMSLDEKRSSKLTFALEAACSRVGSDCSKSKNS